MKITVEWRPSTAVQESRGCNCGSTCGGNSGGSSMCGVVLTTADCDATRAEELVPPLQ